MPQHWQLGLTDDKQEWLSTLNSKESWILPPRLNKKQQNSTYYHHYPTTSRFNPLVFRELWREKGNAVTEAVGLLEIALFVVRDFPPFTFERGAGQGVLFSPKLSEGENQENKEIKNPARRGN